MPDELDSLHPDYDGAKGRYYLSSIFGAGFCHEMMADFDLPQCHDETEKPRAGLLRAVFCRLGRERRLHRVPKLPVPSLAARCMARGFAIERQSELFPPEIQALQAYLSMMTFNRWQTALPSESSVMLAETLCPTAKSED